MGIRSEARIKIIKNSSVKAVGKSDESNIQKLERQLATIAGLSFSSEDGYAREQLKELLKKRLYQIGEWNNDKVRIILPKDFNMFQNGTGSSTTSFGLLVTGREDETRVEGTFTSEFSLFDQNSNNRNEFRARINELKRVEKFSYNYQKTHDPYKIVTEEEMNKLENLEKQVKQGPEVMHRNLPTYGRLNSGNQNLVEYLRRNVFGTKYMLNVQTEKDIVERIISDDKIHEYDIVAYRKHNKKTTKRTYTVRIERTSPRYATATLMAINP